jgi:hypothetical protein
MRAEKSEKMPSERGTKKKTRRRRKPRKRNMTRVPPQVARAALWVRDLDDRLEKARPTLAGIVSGFGWLKMPSDGADEWAWEDGRTQLVDGYDMHLLALFSEPTTGLDDENGEPILAGLLPNPNGRLRMELCWGSPQERLAVLRDMAGEEDLEVLRQRTIERVQAAVGRLEGELEKARLLLKRTRTRAGIPPWQKLPARWDATGTPETRSRKLPKRRVKDLTPEPSEETKERRIAARVRRRLKEELDAEWRCELAEEAVGPPPSEEEADGLADDRELSDEELWELEQELMGEEESES